MDIGTEKPAIIVEPIEDPFREHESEPREQPAHEPEPVEPVPAAFDGRAPACSAALHGNLPPAGGSRKEPS